MTSAETFLRTYTELKESRIQIYRSELDEWFQLGLEKVRYDLLIIMISGRIYDVDTRFSAFNKLFRLLLVTGYAQRASALISADKCRITDISETILCRYTFDKNYMVVFSHSRMAPLILRLASEHGYKRMRTHFLENRRLRRLRTARWTLVRFWLCVRKLLPLWSESLYVPGTGAMYKKALERFNTNC